MGAGLGAEMRGGLARSSQAGYDAWLPGNTAGKRSQLDREGGNRAIEAELRGAPGYHWSGRDEARKFASGLDEAGLNKYYARLPRKRGR